MKSSFIIKTFLILFIFSFSLICAKSNLHNLPLLAHYDFEDARAQGWEPNIPEHWRIVHKEDSMVYELNAPGWQGKFRAPTSWSVLSEHEVTSFVFTGSLKCNADTTNKHRDLCIFFHFKDPTHFYYVHFSAISDNAHNIIGLVNGADRIKINRELQGESAFRLTDKEWHTFKVTYDASSEEIKAYLDDMKTPILTAQDNTFTHGLVGVGSFDDTGYFDDITLNGKKRSQ